MTPQTAAPALTIAEHVSALLGDDGQQWESQDGRSLDELCEDRGAHPSYARSARADGANEDHFVEVSRGDIYSAIRYGFADGSAIVACGDAWDVEGDVRFVWRGA